MRVLVVEDAKDMNRLIVKTLTRGGIQRGRLLQWGRGSGFFGWGGI